MSRKSKDMKLPDLMKWWSSSRSRFPKSSSWFFYPQPAMIEVHQMAPQRDPGDNHPKLPEGIQTINSYIDIWLFLYVFCQASKTMDSFHVFIATVMWITHTPHRPPHRHTPKPKKLDPFPFGINLSVKSEAQLTGSWRFFETNEDFPSSLLSFKRRLLLHCLDLPWSPWHHIWLIRYWLVSDVWENLAMARCDAVDLRERNPAPVAR